MTSTFSAPAPPDHAVSLATEPGPMLTHVEVRRFLKQQFPMLMVDTVLSIDPGERIVAVKNVSGNEWQFLGHFPDYPLMPGVLLIESLAQTAAFLGWCPDSGKKEPSLQYLGNANVTFYKPVHPGDQIVNEVKQTRRVANMQMVGVTARVRGSIVARGELTLASRKDS